MRIITVPVPAIPVVPAVHPAATVTAVLSNPVVPRTADLGPPVGQPGHALAAGPGIPCVPRLPVQLVSKDGIY